jgi:hypothetical protein
MKLRVFGVSTFERGSNVAHLTRAEDDMSHPAQCVERLPWGSCNAALGHLASGSYGPSMLNGPFRLDFNGLGNRQCIFKFHAQIPDCAVHLGVS